MKRLISTGGRARLSFAFALSLVLAPLGVVPAVAAAETPVDVEVSGRLLDANGSPLAGVAITVWQWDEDSSWQALLPSGDPLVSAGDGRFAMHLNRSATYTLQFMSPGASFPVQYLGGTTRAPLLPPGAGGGATTFTPEADHPLGAITLFSVHTATGSVVGDEDGASLSGSVILYDVTRGEPPHADGTVDSGSIAPDGSYRLEGLRSDRRYTVQALVPSYLETYVGSTTQPELAHVVTVGPQRQSLPEFALRRGASVSGTVTADGAPLGGVFVTALRWDALDLRWLAPQHWDGLETATEPDGTWGLALEPGARYTLRFETAFTGSAHPDQYLGGGTTPPGPDDDEATFVLDPSGATIDHALLEPPVVEPPVTGPPVTGPPIGAPPVVGPPVVEPPTGPPATPPATSRAASTTVLTLSTSSARFGAKVTATVAVRAAAGTPNGTVRLTLDGRTLATKRPQTSGTRAIVKFVLPRTLTTGTHRLVASAAQTTTVSASTSATRTLKVTKAKVTLKVKGPKKWTVARGERPSLTVTVKGTAGGPRPAGKVTVKIGTKTYTKAVTAGRATVRGAKLKARGKVKVTITYVPKAKTYTKPKAVKKTVRVR